MAYHAVRIWNMHEELRSATTLYGAKLVASRLLISAHCDKSTVNFYCCSAHLTNVSVHSQCLYLLLFYTKLADYCGILIQLIQYELY